MSSLSHKFKRLRKNPLLPMASMLRKMGPVIPDKLYLKLLFFFSMGYPLHLDHPRTYSEKLQWLKLYHRDPAYTRMVDKYEAKKYVAEVIGEEHIIPTIGIYDTVDEIPWHTLPEQFVLKCTHDSGGIVICKDKSRLNIDKAKKKIAKGLKKSYYSQYREWPYVNVKPRIICEEYKVDESGYELKDYKWFCFDGEAKALFIATDRDAPGKETKFDFYDADFNHLPFTNGHPNSNIPLQKPAGFEKMKELAERLSKGIPHVRVDLYNINGRIYFGEMTFFHWSGIIPFEPKEWDVTFGSWIKLPEKKLPDQEKKG